MEPDGSSEAEALIEATFIDLEYEPATTDSAALTARLALICDVWPLLTIPYEFLKLAHFLEDDSSVVAQELYDAALRTAWRLRTAESDPWEDEWWFEAVEAITDVSRQDALRRLSAEP